jgi:hypothetical protein
MIVPMRKNILAGCGNAGSLKDFPPIFTLEPDKISDRRKLGRDVSLLFPRSLAEQALLHLVSHKPSLYDDLYNNVR